MKGLTLGLLGPALLATAACSVSGIEPVVTTLEPKAAPEVQECSAAELQAGTADQGENERVRAARDAIVAAAVQCDYELLAEIAAPGFVASFGGGDPVDLWREAEEAGDPVLATLVHVLRSPHVRDQEGTYVWPSLVSGDAEAAELDELEKTLGTDLEGWFLDGMYVGPRVGIRADGDWVFYVNGD
jgi:hypothetical protein